MSSGDDRRGRVSRREFLGAGAALVTVGIPAIVRAGSQLPSRLVHPSLDTAPWGMALIYGEGKLDLLDLDTSTLLHTFEGLRATHAVTPVESLNRFVVHGHRTGSRVGAVIVLEVDPRKKTWKQILDADLPGGPALHWQPNPDYSEIMFNTIGDGGLHVLNTTSLELSSFTGGGNHSNMAFFEDLLVATDSIRGPTTLRVVDRKTGDVLSSTPVGRWGHGVTVNREHGTAFVWSDEGLHVVSLARSTMGKHLKVLKPQNDRERCWFCWTPQGGRYSHDVSWNPGDEYHPYLLVADMKNQRFERIPTGDKELLPSYLQISPGGRWGLSSIRGAQEIAVFDTVQNQFKGTVKAGRAHIEFFERDMAFCRDRSRAVVTNSAENSISLLDLDERSEHRRITLPRRPTWMKVLSPA